jgi:hypothetical protein
MSGASRSRPLLLAMYQIFGISEIGNATSNAVGPTRRKKINVRMIPPPRRPSRR